MARGLQCLQKRRIQVIILGNLGVANKRLINQFLDEWYEFDDVSYNQYHKSHNGVGQNMVEYLKYNDPIIYFYVLDRLEESYAR